MRADAGLRQQVAEDPPTMTTKTWTFLGALALVTTTFAACSSDDEPAASTSDTTGDSEGTSGGGTTDPTTTTTSSTSSTTAEPTTSSSTSSSGTDSDSANFIETTDTTTSGAGSNGSPCTMDSECSSGKCFGVPGLGGLCSECNMDSDCPEGEACAIDPGFLFAVCTPGQLGTMCMTDEGCGADLVCASVIPDGAPLPLPIDLAFCSECDAETACTNGEICVQVLSDLGEFQVYNRCAAPGSVPNGDGCPSEGGVGDGTACMSGICNVVPLDIQGLITFDVGLCGACASDADCAMGETCTPGSVSADGPVASACTPM
jgi:hypothetical protein